MNIAIGNTIRLKAEVASSNHCPEGRENNGTAKIRALLDHGGIQTDRDLGGCRYWNAADIERVN